MPMIFDNISGYTAVSATPITILPNGSLKYNDNTIERTPIEKNTWFNAKVFVNLENHTMDIYINDKKVKEGLTISEQIQQISLVRFHFPAEKGTSKYGLTI